jgi:DNA-binding LytR/AlgR family response regulator
MLRCIAVDDEPLALRLLADYIEKTDGLHLVEAFSDPILALRCIQDEQIDVVFLDVHMPELTGIQFMKIIQGNCQVVLCTAYNEYAVDGFNFNATDFLTKPIGYERFLLAVEKCRDQARPEQATMTQITDTALPYLFVKDGSKIRRVDLADIVYLQGYGDYVAIQTRTDKILSPETMKQYEHSLPASQFIRVHKSYIVSLDKIDYVENNRVVIASQRIPIGATYKEAFFHKMKQS